MRLKTFISPVMFRKNLFSPELSQLQAGETPICWLDALFGGGIEVPAGITGGQSRPLIWLISGPPGSGKTTLALEICHNIASKKQPSTGDTLTACYCSTESPVELLRHSCKAFGWQVCPPDNLTIIGDETLGECQNLGELVKKIPARHAQSFHHFVVVDSLNLLSPELAQSRLKVIHAVQQELTGKCWIVILMHDWEHDRGDEPSLAFAADIETRLSFKERRGYYLNYFRIVKMRYQDHARGEQLVKIYGPPKGEALKERTPAGDRAGIERAEGGFFVLPSIHRHLSAIVGGKKEISYCSLDVAAINEDKVIKSPIDGLDVLTPLGRDKNLRTVGGFPKGCCTAFVGSRGGMKSYLAYLILLRQLQNDSKASGVMFSLRDDTEAAEFTLQQLCIQQGIDPKLVCELRQSNRLDIVYFAPGYLPPEEFMHRVVVAIEGMIQRHNSSDGRDVVVVLNGIDHLAVRHPLCADERMFVPALISHLNEEQVSSFVIAATDESGAVESSGIMPMAELLICFESIGVEVCSRQFAGKQVTKLIVQRVPAGATGGGWGYLARDAGTGTMRFELPHA